MDFHIIHGGDHWIFQFHNFSGVEMKCVRCDVQLDELKWIRLSREDYVFQPMGGAVFWTNGHYGSAVFDPMDGSTMHLVVCDDCLKHLMISKQAVVKAKDESNN